MYMKIQRERSLLCTVRVHSYTHTLYARTQHMYVLAATLPPYTHTHIMQVWVYMPRHTHSPKYVNSLVRKGNPTKSYTTQHM